MKNPFSYFRLQTRLALIMLLIMGITSAFLTVTYVNYTNRIMNYLSLMTSELLAVSQLAQARIPADANRDQAIDEYEKVLNEYSLSYTLTSSSGQVLKSTNPTLVGKKYKIKHTPPPAAKQEPIRFTAHLDSAEAGTNLDQPPNTVEFPIVQGDKVIGYAEVQVPGFGDQLNALLSRHFRDRLELTLATMLTGMIIVVYLASRFTRPINALVKGAQQVARGDLNVQLPATDSDEMGRLAQTFNQMVERLRENRQLQERLNEAEKLSLLGRFAATVAHEVRNSLNFINLSIDQIRAKYTGGDEHMSREMRRNLNNIKDEIARQNRLVNDFLAAGRQAPPALAPCDLRQTLKQAFALVEKQAHSQDISLTLDLPADLPRLQADAAQLQTCFLNILTNAIQAMPSGGKIRVSAERLASNGHPAALRLLFADTGPGIPVENRDRVFNQFFSTKTTGFGLGLAITRKIVEDHGGHIRVSDTHAPGTVIVVDLPLHESPAVSAPNPTSVVA